MPAHLSGMADHCIIRLSSRVVGHWALLVLTLPAAQRGAIVPRLTLLEASGTEPVGETFPSRLLWSNIHYAICFVPLLAERVAVQTLGDDDAIWRASLRAFPLNRGVIAAYVMLRYPRNIVGALLSGPAGVTRRVHALVAILASRLYRAPSYRRWIELFDTWLEEDILGLLTSPDRPNWPTVMVLVFCQQAETSQAAQATLVSLQNQVIPMTTHILRPTMSPPLIYSLDYALLLQAGEVLPRHATALLLDYAAKHGHPPILLGDDDQLTPDGQRHAPMFKPRTGYPLMLSGTLTRGAWLVRGDVMNNVSRGQTWAEAMRLDAWLRADEGATEPVSRHAPFVLTHRRYDTETAPADALAAVITSHLSRAGRRARVDATRLPIRVTPLLARGPLPPVTLIVPSACRAAHVTRCLGALLGRTRYAAMDVIVVVTQNGPLDPQQTRVLRPIIADARVNVIIRSAADFNYAAANNFGANEARGQFLCLVNDDVEPLAEDWLSAMLGHFSDSRVGVVGAKLYYSDATIQHDGLLLGVGGVAGHMNRFCPRGSPGYAGRAVVNQTVSSVTGACMLVRREVFCRVGGFDEAYPTAYNDVDFCLRVNELGLSVVESADAELYHYESLSLGHHFAGPHAGREVEQVCRIRNRWGAVLHEDPFHNPNLSQRLGCEWDPAYPPRVAKPGGHVR